MGKSKEIGTIGTILDVPYLRSLQDFITLSKSIPLVSRYGIYRTVKMITGTPGEIFEITYITKKLDPETRTRTLTYGHT